MSRFLNTSDSSWASSLRPSKPKKFVLPSKIPGACGTMRRKRSLGKSGLQEITDSPKKSKTESCRLLEVETKKTVARKLSYEKSSSCKQFWKPIAKKLSIERNIKHVSKKNSVENVVVLVEKSLEREPVLSHDEIRHKILDLDKRVARNSQLATEHIGYLLEENQALANEASHYQVENQKHFETIQQLKKEKVGLCKTISELRSELDSYRNATSDEKNKTDQLQQSFYEFSKQNNDLTGKLEVADAENRMLDDHLRVERQKSRALELQVQELILQNGCLKTKLKSCQTRERSSRHQLQDFNRNIPVIARLVGPANSNVVDVVSDDILKINEPDGTSLFHFDRVFDIDSCMEDVFLEVEHLSDSLLKGEHGCVLSFETGNLKTSFSELIQRTVGSLLTKSEGKQQDGWEYSLKVSYFEITDDSVSDLLGKDSSRLPAGMRAETTTANVASIRVGSKIQLSDLLNRASKQHQPREGKKETLYCIFRIRLTAHEAFDGIHRETYLNLINFSHAQLADVIEENISSYKQLTQLFSSSRNLNSQDNKFDQFLCECLSEQPKMVVVFNIPSTDQDLTTTMSCVKLAQGLRKISLISSSSDEEY